LDNLKEQYHFEDIGVHERWNVKKQILQMSTGSGLRRTFSSESYTPGFHNREFLDKVNNVRPLKEDAAMESLSFY
jgi:hypothetical protein